MKLLDSFSDCISNTRNHMYIKLNIILSIITVLSLFHLQN